MRLRILLTALALATPVHAEFMTGEDFVNLPEDIQMGYVVGVMDSMEVGMGRSPIMQVRLSCVIKAEMSPDLLTRAVKVQIDSDRKYLGKPARDAVVAMSHNICVLLKTNPEAFQ